MRRCLLCLCVAALVAAGSAAAAGQQGEPVETGGSAIGEGTPFKAYASMTPVVHLFGDVVTARLAVVADSKWVDPSRLRVITSFRPYTPLRAPTLTRVHIGRFEQLTWSWKLHCIVSPCVPRAPGSDKYHVFHFTPAQIDYVSPAGKRLYGINAYWPSVEVVSQVTPGEQQRVLRTNQFAWRYQLRPVAAPSYRFPPAVVFWTAVALAGLLALAAAGLAVRWARGLRPARAVKRTEPATTLERALAVLLDAHRSGDETLQRKAFERVAGELGVERTDDLSRVARELAWSPRTPAEDEVEDFASQAIRAQEDRP